MFRKLIAWFFKTIFMGIFAVYFWAIEGLNFKEAILEATHVWKNDNEYYS